jgi:uncharacterized protein (TIGR03083 family)
MKKNSHYEQVLTEARQNLKSLLASLSQEQWQTVVISEGQAWTVQDIVAHLLENEQAMSVHVHKIRQGRETVPAGFSLEQWNAGLKERMTAAPPEELLQGLDKARTKTLEVLATIKEDEWALAGNHPLRGQITIAQYYETIAGHDTWHTKDIRKGLGLV